MQARVVSPRARALVLACVLVAPTTARAAQDRTEAPYFLIQGADAFPLESSEASIHVVDAVAEARVTQVYRNEGRRPIEAVYVFPLSTRAAVHALKMKVGGRTIEAQIRERDQARRTYEQARASGHTASLLEQQRPNVFQMAVSNILPGDEVRVELAYTEALVPTERVYELAYPTVVGPRYTGARAEAWASPPIARGQPPFRSRFEATIDAGLPIAALESASHAILVERPTPRRCQVRLGPGEDRGDRDVILRYRLAGDAIAAGVVVEGAGPERYFSVTVEPPARVSEAAVLPREYVFILDVSGSMYGFPLRVAGRLMRELFAQLRPIDRFNILTFSGGHDVLAPSPLPATRENLERAAAFLERAHGGGGTELLPALDAALALPRAERAARVVAVVTDGYVTVEREAFERVRGALGQASLFAFGIGSAVNRYLIEGLARAGGGEPFVVTDEASAPAEARRFADYIRAPLLSGVEVRVEGATAYDLEPAVIPDLFAARPLVVRGKIHGPATGRVVVRGRTAAGPFSTALDLGQASLAATGTVGRLWARARIARLSDDAPTREHNRAAIIALGLTHHLVTAYTSFVGVGEAVRATEPGVKMHQPVATPHGVDALLDGPMEGTLGLGNLGVVGRGGGGGGSSYGYGGGLGGLSGRRLTNVAAGPVTVQGALDHATIRRILRAHQGEIHALYLRELAAAKWRSGELVLELRIDEQGRVSQARVVTSTFAMPGFERGLVELAKGWSFPTGGATVRYPIRIAP